MAKELMEELKSIGEHEIVVNKQYVTVDDNYTKLDIATDDTIGLIKTGYTQSEKNYPVKVDSSGNAYTNVPWTDTIFEPNVILGGDLYTEYTEVSRSYPSQNNLFTVTVDKPYPGLNSTIYLKLKYDYNPSDTRRLCLVFSDSSTTMSCYVNSTTFYVISSLSSKKIYCFNVSGTSSSQKIIISREFESKPIVVPTMIGSDGTSAGFVGLVPAPPAGAGKKYLRGDATWQSIADFSVSTATSSTEGIMKLGSDTVQTIRQNSPSAVRDRTYPVQLNSDNQAVVNVPWESGGSYTLPLATDRERGGIKVGFITDETIREYAVELNSDEQAYVRIPWTDTTYNTATASTLGLIKIGFTQSGKNYPVLLNSNNQAYVNVPWTDTKYSLPTATTDTLGGIKIANKRNSSITSKYGTVKSNRYYGIELDSNSKAFVCVPWSDTVVTKTSELNNDSNFVSDSNYVHTDNNYTTADQTKLQGMKNTTLVFTFTDDTTQSITFYTV